MRDTERARARRALLDAASELHAASQALSAASDALRQRPAAVETVGPIEPGKVYALLVERPVPVKVMDEWRRTWKDRTGADCVFVGPGLRFAGETTQ